MGGGGTYAWVRGGWGAWRWGVPGVEPDRVVPLDELPHVPAPRFELGVVARNATQQLYQQIEARRAAGAPSHRKATQVLVERCREVVDEHRDRARRDRLNEPD